MALRLGRFTPWKKAGWAPEIIWTVWRSEIFLPYRDSNSELSVVQQVASRYIDFANVAVQP
jgi:hypothetical protein